MAHAAGSNGARPGVEVEGVAEAAARGAPASPPPFSPDMVAARLGRSDYTDAQCAAIAIAESAPVMLLTGAAGCGKTYTTRAIVKVVVGGGTGFKSRQ